MDTAQDWLALIATVAAATAGTLYMARQAWRFFTALHNLHELLQHELNPNGGGSIKDDVAATAVAIGKLQADVADLTETQNTAHQLLQLQLDQLAGVVESHHPTHKREDHNHDLQSDT